MTATGKSTLAERLDAINEFDREPVAENRLQGPESFMALYAGEHVAGTEFVIGPLFVAHGVTASDLISGLLVGNLLAVMSWAFIAAPIATRTRLNLYWHLRKITGPKLLFIYNIINALMFCFLAGSMISVAATAVGLPVGMTIALQDLQAVEGGEATRDRVRQEIQDVFLEAARGDDFVGVQTYSRERFGPEGRLGPEEGVELTQMGYEFWPEALEATIRYAVQVAGVPVIVTENGIGTNDDTRRIEYYRRALRGVVNCLNDGLDVRGYFAWSAFDNFEWMMGYAKTFGLIAVNRETQERSVKSSARWLGEMGKKKSFVDVHGS